MTSEAKTDNFKIFKNTMALYIRMGITMIISFFTTRFTLQILGVEDYGLNNVVSSLVTMFSFINGSMGTAVQRFYSIEIGKSNNPSILSRIFSSAMYLHLLIAVITFLIAQIFLFFSFSTLTIPMERLMAAKHVFQISVISLVFNILNVPYAALLRAREEFAKIAILDILQSVLRLLVLFLLFAISYDKLVSLALFNLAITLIYFVSIILVAGKYQETKFKISRDKEYIKKMLSFISMLILTVLASVFNKQGVILLVNVFFGLTVNAAYAIAFQISNILETFAMNFKQSVVPQLMVSYASDDFERMNKLMFLGTKATFFLMMLISIPLFLEADFILKIWLSPPPLYAAQFTQLMIIQVNIDTFSYFIYQSVHASGKIKKQQLYTSLSYFFSVFVTFLFFKLEYNFYYAVYVAIVFSLIRNFIIMSAAKESIDINLRKYTFNVVAKSVLFAGILFFPSACIINTLNPSMLRLLIILLLNFLFAVIIGYYLFLDRTEKNLLLNIVSKMKQKFK
mgnify:CR=1 FL=1